jgi:hypothetical protein
MKTIKWILLVAFVGLIIGQLAAAETIIQTIDFPEELTDWEDTGCVDKFNLPCELISVTVSISTHGFEAYAADNEGPAASDFEMNLDGWTDTTMPNGDIERIDLDHQNEVFDLPEDEPVEDPNPDFEGVDSFSKDFEDTKSKDVTYTDPADLAHFIGDGEVCFATTADARQSSSGSSNVRESKDAFIDQTIVVTYEYICTYCIRGSKIDDCTSEGLPGWTINLMDENGIEIDSTTTLGDGSYEFCDLVPGEYTVCEEVKEGWTNVGPTCISVTLTDVDAEDVDFTNTQLFCIEGHKFNAKTGEGLSGWTINLQDENGIVIDSTTTGQGGLYRFCDLAPGEYTVCEVMKSGWKNVGPTCISVTLDCGNSIDNDFSNELIVVSCGVKCPWYIKHELYRAQCGVEKVVPAESGVLANDPKGATVVDPESITIDAKYGTLEVYEDGSFVYDPSPSIRSGTYVIFYYTANNGLCDATNKGMAKIQVSCK